MKMQKKRLFLLCGIIYLFLSFNQSFAITWGLPQTISTSASAGNVDLAINDNDIAIASWTSWNGTINRVSTAFFSGTWQAPVHLTSSLSSFESRAAINATNNAIVAFITDNGTTCIVQACFYNGTTWSAPVTISSTSLKASHMDLTMNDSDEALLVWRSEGGASPVIEAAFFNGTTWSATVTISNGATFSDEPRVSMNNAGDAFAVWESFDTVSVYDIQVAFFDGGTSTWGAPTVISDVANTAMRPKIAINTTGNAVAIWETIPNGTENCIIRSANYVDATSTWSAPTSVVTGPGMIAFSSDLAYNDLGNAVAVWSQLVTATTFEVYASLSLMAGVWNAPTLISNPALSSTKPKVSMNASDVIVATFLSLNAGVNEVHANSYIAAAWEGSSLVSNSGVLSFNPAVALNNNSISFAGWGSEATDGEIRVSQGTFP